MKDSALSYIQKFVIGINSWCMPTPLHLKKKEKKMLVMYNNNFAVSVQRFGYFCLGSEELRIGL